MSFCKRAAVASSPLGNAGILLHVFNILGPGQHLLVSAVSKAWRESYGEVDSLNMVGNRDYDDMARLYTITSKTTLGSAVLASPPLIRLAHDCGLTFDNDELQRTAGKLADLATLQAAFELGLPLSYAFELWQRRDLKVADGARLCVHILYLRRCCSWSSSASLAVFARRGVSLGPTCLHCCCGTRSSSNSAVAA
jgi:hypothetical protein